MICWQVCLPFSSSQFVPSFFSPSNICHQSQNYQNSNHRGIMCYSISCVSWTKICFPSPIWVVQLIIYNNMWKQMAITTSQSPWWHVQESCFARPTVQNICILQWYMKKHFWHLFTVFLGNKSSNNKHTLTLHRATSCWWKCIQDQLRHILVRCWTGGNASVWPISINIIASSNSVTMSVAVCGNVHSLPVVLTSMASVLRACDRSSWITHL